MRKSLLAIAVREARTVASLSVRDLAARSGVTETWLRQVEVGSNARPDPDRLTKVAAALGLPKDPFLLLRPALAPASPSGARPNGSSSQNGRLPRAAKRTSTGQRSNGKNHAPTVAKALLAAGEPLTAEQVRAIVEAAITPLADDIAAAREHLMTLSDLAEAIAELAAKMPEQKKRKKSH